jgi:alkanesulfonate monooxygenase SsuD/methylene tetrahydromethanopterin reductase-like flavin-dependent oxidoreductase (luciferase family)
MPSPCACTAFKLVSRCEDARPEGDQRSVWIPGVISPETIVWAAEHGYPYIALNTPVERTQQIWKIYDEAAAAAGFQVARTITAC